MLKYALTRFLLCSISTLKVNNFPVNHKLKSKLIISARLAVFNIKDWIKAYHTDEATQRIEKAEIRMAQNNPSRPIPMNIIRKRYLKPFFSELVQLSYSLFGKYWGFQWPSMALKDLVYNRWIKTQQKNKSKAQLSSKYIWWFSFNMSLSYLRKYRHDDGVISNLSPTHIVCNICHQHRSGGPGLAPIGPIGYFLSHF